MISCNGASLMNETVRAIIKLYKMGKPWPLFVYFRLFKQTLQFLLEINVKKCPSSIWRRDLSSKPSDNESPPLTTRPGLMPLIKLFLFLWPMSSSV